MAAMLRSALILSTCLVACGGSNGGRDDGGPTGADAAPGGRDLPPLAIHIRTDPNYMDTAWCHLSFVPEQDPVFPTIRRDRFDSTPAGIVVTPASWIEEAKTRVPALQAAVSSRTRQLLDSATAVAGRPFGQRDFSFLLYYCPFFGGGSAIPGIYPLFPYLAEAVGDLQWPDWIFTDEYMFHEILHLYVMEKIDYAKGSPMLTDAYQAVTADADFYGAVSAYLGHAPTADEMVSFVGLVMTHLHLDALMTRTYLALDEADNLERIKSYEIHNPAPHPSYVEAWALVDAYTPEQVDALLAELR